MKFVLTKMKQMVKNYSIYDPPLRLKATHNNSKPMDMSLNAEEKYHLVPEDFPRAQQTGAVAGAQPKVLMVEYQGEFFLPGASPPERYERWDICEDLAKQLSIKSLDSKAGKRSYMSHSEILQQYADRLHQTGWVSAPEGKWVMQRVAIMLGWRQLVGL